MDDNFVIRKSDGIIGDLNILIKNTSTIFSVLLKIKNGERALERDVDTDETTHTGRIKVWS